ncbi:MAG: hypothetical protein AB1898_15765 [Acidobacteriota bacterium]
MQRFEEDRRRALAQALNAQVVREFTELLPMRVATLSNYQIPSLKQSLTVQATLFSRYELRLDLVLEFDKTWTEVIHFGEPQFQLNEVEEVEPLEDGRLSVSYAERSQREFGDEEWKRLYKADGDFTVLGIYLRKDVPVPLFDEYWRRMEERFREN